MSVDNSHTPSFRYQNVLDMGKPIHNGADSFSVRHPAMDLSRRAKIFSPFDALKGFGDELERAKAEITDTFSDDTVPPEEPP